VIVNHQISLSLRLGRLYPAREAGFVLSRRMRTDRVAREFRDTMDATFFSNQAATRRFLPT
jgi:hypothetical protein